jgi:SAM-dependent methyltransferase
MDDQTDVRERTKELAAEFLNRGDATGWFDALYSEANGDNEKIPWADLEPNKFLVKFAGEMNLQGNGRRALVVGCGLGDDAKFLHDLGFEVTAFDISPTAIEWAKKLYPAIHFETADLFTPPRGWISGFEFVLEIYTIQPLPLELRPKVIDSIADFVAPNGTLLIVTRGREDNEIPPELPWALSRQDLSQFEKHGFRQTHFEEMFGDEEEPIRRFVVEYQR